MKAYPGSRTYFEDKKMLNTFDKNLSNILSLNSAYLIDFPTAKLLINELSSETMKDKFSTALDDIKEKNGDSHNTDNYIQTFKKLLNMARVKINEQLDIQATDKHSPGEPA